VTPFGVLRVQNVAVNHDVEHAFGTGNERQLTDDVLVVEQQILRRAHGAL
jgi:hypothetical protein